MNGTITERIIKKGKDKKGKIRENLKVYDVYYRYIDPNTGKWRQTSKKGFRSKGEAEAFILKTNSLIAENAFVQPKKITVREYLLDWLDSYVRTNLRASTIAGYEINIEKHIIPHLGNIELQSLTSSHIDGFYAQKLKTGRIDGKGGLSAKSVMYIHRVLNEALEHAIKKKLITHNVSKDVTNLPRLKKYKSLVYDSKEIKELLQVVRDTDMEVPVVLAAISGMRRGEVLGLKKTDISFENQTIRIRRQLIATKTGLVFEDPKSEDSNRIIHPPVEVIKIIEKHLNRQEETKKLLGNDYQNMDLVNCYPDGRPIDPRYFSHKFSNVLEKSGLKHIRFHDLRYPNLNKIQTYSRKTRIVPLSC